MRATVAFNAMQCRITEYLAERMQILAVVSHDLQTPITRMRLRTDLLGNAEMREKLQGVTGAPCRTDLNALLDSLVCDYQELNNFQVH